jgi:Uma2 family endonuclease
MSITLSPELLQQLPQRGWSRAEFERMAELGLFADEKLELIEGVITEKMTQNSPHATVIYRAPRALERVFDEAHFMVRVQAPLNLGARSQPEPDIAVVQGNWQQWTQQHPTTASLIVEVSDSTPETDRTIKASLYARSGIHEYWIVNVAERRLEFHRDAAPMSKKPLGYGYRNVQILTETDSTAPIAAPDATIAVSDLLP